MYIIFFLGGRGGGWGGWFSAVSTLRNQLYICLTIGNVFRLINLKLLPYHNVGGPHGNIIWDWCWTYIATLSSSLHIICNSFVLVLFFNTVCRFWVSRTLSYYCTIASLHLLLRRWLRIISYPSYFYLFIFHDDHCSCGNTAPALIPHLTDSCDLHNAQRCRKCRCVVVGILHS